MNEQRKKNWKRVMNLIHQVEDRYGSIHSTPSDDPNWMKICSLCSFKNKSGSGFVKISLEKKELIVAKIKQGHSKYEVKMRCHVSGSTIDRGKAEYGVNFIPSFEYILKKSGEQPFYFRSKRLDLECFFHRPFSTRYKLNSYLDKNGWTLKCKRTIWSELPQNVKYSAKSHAEILVKTDDKYRG